MQMRSNEHPVAHVGDLRRLPHTTEALAANPPPLRKEHSARWPYRVTNTPPLRGQRCSITTCFPNCDAFSSLTILCSVPSQTQNTSSCGVKVGSSLGKLFAGHAVGEVDGRNFGQSGSRSPARCPHPKLGRVAGFLGPPPPTLPPRRAPSPGRALP